MLRRNIQGRSVLHRLLGRIATMRERSYWDDAAEAMELTIAGNQLIVGEIAGCIRDEWRTAMRWIVEALHRIPHARHSPPA
jgi:hypothetical protein